MVLIKSVVKSYLNENEFQTGFIKC